MSVRHKKHSTAVGSDDPNKVHPSDWNDEHVNADGTPVTGMRVIGPFRVNFDDANINLDIVTLDVVLVDGDIVVGVWAFFPTGWKSDTNVDCDFKIEVASYPTPSRSFVLKEYSAPGTGAYPSIEPSIGPTRTAIADYAEWSAAAGSSVTAIQLAVEVYVNGGDHFTQGSADVYALIADPA